MSASNDNWVCFACRTIVRQPKEARRVPKCPECGATCDCMGDRVALPRKTEIQKWKNLKQSYVARAALQNEADNARKRRLARFTREQIRELEERGADNPDRQRLIAALRKKIEPSRRTTDDKR